MSYEIVWFKRDLRIHDNAAISLACKSGNPIIFLYILEPQLWSQPDMSKRHLEFLDESLQELAADLANFGQKLIIQIGDALEIMQKIHQQFTINNIFSHQETWNYWTFARDKKILAWTKNQNIKWHEPVQNGVIRRLKDRNGWAANWNKLMQQKILPIPQFPDSNNSAVTKLISQKLPTFSELNLAEDNCRLRQKGGRKIAFKLLNSFLYKRGENYTREMSSPLTAFRSCSLLSPYISFGTISLREIFQAVEKRQIELQAMSKNAKGNWPTALRSFGGRLRWHCHFIQKLEDEPKIEFANFHPAYDSLRLQCNDEFLQAWQQGKTGFPMVDATMRCLIATGWINFRMRAMLMSFASYHLWLPWQKTALHLARLFTDYEPGIHYSQVQMQSGTTGINAVRIYNPIKQSFDQDPQGIFIRKWITELEEMPDEFIHTPWQKPELLNGYPLPIVDEAQARKEAAAKIYALRKDTEHKITAKKIVIKHGSRKSGLKQSRNASEIKEKVRKKKKGVGNEELQLDLFAKNSV